MLSETLTEGLESYRIGSRIRALRQDKGIGLVQLGEHTGLSPGMLSKLERGQLVPTLPTLLRIALVFGVGLEHFFVEDDQPKVAVVRKGERLGLPNPPESDMPDYYFECLDFPARDRRMQAFLASFENAGRDSDAHTHAGAELIYVIEGQLIVTVDGNETVLNEGDAMHFDADRPHSYRRGASSGCSAIVVVAQ